MGKRSGVAALVAMLVVCTAATPPSVATPVAAAPEAAAPDAGAMRLAASDGRLADQVRLRVGVGRVGSAPGVATGTHVRVESSGPAITGRLSVRRVNGPTVRSWAISGVSSFSRWFDATAVRSGYYLVTVTARPTGRSEPTVRHTVQIRVVRPAPTVARTTQYGYVQPVPVRRPVNRRHLEVHESMNQLLVVDRRNETVRHIPIAGNPAVGKPKLSYVADPIRLSYDYGFEWRLPWFVRLVGGRGIGSHAIPRRVGDGHPIMRVADLGKRPGAGAPLSHGCLRMHDAHARWIHENLPRGTPVYWL